MKSNSEMRLDRQLNADDLIVIAGAGGFIAGALARYFHNLGFTHIRAIDRKPLPEWYQRVPGVECLSMDLSEKAPAAICRKMLEAIDSGRHSIEIWGDGTQTRSFCYIDDCVFGIDRIMHSQDLIATPINLGSSELISIDNLAGMVEDIAGVELARTYDLNAPTLRSGMERD